MAPVELYDFEIGEFFQYIPLEGTRIYRNGLRIDKNGSEHYPDGTTRGPPQGCWMRYFHTEDEVLYKKVSLHNSLGQGAFGKVDVVQAINIDTSKEPEERENSGQREFARKEYHQKDFSNSSEKSAAQVNLEREIGIYNKLEEVRPTDHRVTIVDAYTVRKQQFFLIMHPVAQGGTLKAKLLDFTFAREERTEAEIRTLRRGIGCLLVAIARIHDKGFRHRDLHPDNILLHEEEILLCDFGASLHTQPEQQSTTSTTFPPKMERYAAPEVISAIGERNRMADVFSLGAILFEIVSALQCRKELAESFVDGGYRYEARINEVQETCHRAHSTELFYISQMLERNQLKRLSAKTVAARFLNSPNFGSLTSMCSDCQKWLIESGEPQRLLDAEQEKSERFRKEYERQERREKHPGLQGRSVKRSQSFEY